MHRREVTPRATAAALILASQTFHVLARQMSKAGDPADPVTDRLLTDAGIHFAGALTYLGALGRRDARFQYEVIRASMLEFLPVLVIGDGLTADRVLLVGQQLDLLAQEIQVHIQVAPKQMTMEKADISTSDLAAVEG